MREHRRYMVINFRVGTRETGYFVGPVLVSTRDYRRFHFWDEADEAVLDQGEYEVVHIYPLGYSLSEAQRRFAAEFPPTWPITLAPTAQREVRPGLYPQLDHALPVTAA